MGRTIDLTFESDTRDCGWIVIEYTVKSNAYPGCLATRDYPEEPPEIEWFDLSVVRVERWGDGLDYENPMQSICDPDRELLAMARRFLLAREDMIQREVEKDWGYYGPR